MPLKRVSSLRNKSLGIFNNLVDSGYRIADNIVKEVKDAFKEAEK